MEQVLGGYGGIGSLEHLWVRALGTLEQHTGLGGDDLSCIVAIVDEQALLLVHSHQSGL